MNGKINNLKRDSAQSRYKVEKSEVLHRNPWYSYNRDEGTREDGGPFEYYYVLGRNDSVAIIAITEGKMILVRQYRYLIDRDSLEVPGGMGNDGENIEDAAKRELLEETGYSSTSMIHIGKFNTATGWSRETVNVFLAENCVKVGDQKLDDSEKGLEVKLYPVEEVYDMVKNRKVDDGFTLSSLMIARPYIAS